MKQTEEEIVRMKKRINELEAENKVLKQRRKKVYKRCINNRILKKAKMTITIMNSIYEYEEGLITDDSNFKGKINIYRLVKMINNPKPLKKDYKEVYGISRLNISRQNIKHHLINLEKKGYIILHPLKLIDKGKNKIIDFRKRSEEIMIKKGEGKKCQECVQTWIIPRFWNVKLD